MFPLLLQCSDYGYGRDDDSGNCLVNSQYITQSNCSTGYDSYLHS